MWSLPREQGRACCGSTTGTPVLLLSLLQRPSLWCHTAPAAISPRDGVRDDVWKHLTSLLTEIQAPHPETDGLHAPAPSSCTETLPNWNWVCKVFSLLLVPVACKKSFAWPYWGDHRSVLLEPKQPLTVCTAMALASAWASSPAVPERCLLTARGTG